MTQNNTVIYKLFNPKHPNLFFIGKTKSYLRNRLSCHRYHARNGMDTILYTNMRDFDLDDWDIEEMATCDTKYANDIEQLYLHLYNPPLNSRRAPTNIPLGLSTSDYKKEYYHRMDAEKRAAYAMVSKNRQRRNKDALNEYNRDRYAYKKAIQLEEKAREKEMKEAIDKAKREKYLTTDGTTKEWIPTTRKPIKPTLQLDSCSDPPTDSDSEQSSSTSSISLSASLSPVYTENPPSLSSEDESYQSSTTSD